MSCDYAAGEGDGVPPLFHANMGKLLKKIDNGEVPTEVLPSKNDLLIGGNTMAGDSTVAPQGRRFFFYGASKIALYSVVEYAHIN